MHATSPRWYGYHPLDEVEWTERMECVKSIHSAEASSPGSAVESTRDYDVHTVTGADRKVSATSMLRLKPLHKLTETQSKYA